MARWLTKYIDENQDRWKEEREERQKNETKRIADWQKMARFEKIRLLKQEQEEKEAAKHTRVKITSARFEVCQAQDVQTDKEVGEDPDWPPMDPPDDQAEQLCAMTDQRLPQTYPSSSHSTPETITQPLTIPRAVARCVKFHNITNNLQPLTSTKPGTGMRTTEQRDDQPDQAEQHCSTVNQATQMDRRDDPLLDAEQADHPAEGDARGDQSHPSISSSKPAKPIQPLTITRVQGRCVSVHDNDSKVQLLITNIPGQPKLDEESPRHTKDDHPAQPVRDDPLHLPKRCC